MDPSTLEQQADRAAASGDFAEALSLLEQAAADPACPPSLFGKLSAMRKAAGDVQGALNALDSLLAHLPLDFAALLSRAMLLEKLGDPRAEAEFGNALTQVPPDSDVPPAMQSAVAHARTRWRAHQEGIGQRLRNVLPSGLDDEEQGRIERFITNHSRQTRHFHQEPSDFHYPSLPEIEFHHRSHFPGIERFEARTEAIRSEFEALIAAEAAEMVPYIQYPERVPLRQWGALNNNRDWTAIHLLQNGQRVESNARHCPLTMAAVAAMPQAVIPGGSPNAMFSLLAPRTRIPPHTGVANVRLVCHLPLIVPPGCGFRVGDTTVEWQVGEAIVFDDTIEHEAWNDSDELRVVLIIDLWAPALSIAERAAVADVIGAVGVTFGGV